MTTHYHLDFSGIKDYFVVREPDPGETGRECSCLDGELELFHDAIDAGEVDEECPCPTCVQARINAFERWRAEQEKAAAKEHTIAGEAGPDV